MLDGYGKLQLLSPKNFYRMLLHGDTIVVSRNTTIYFFNRSGKFLHSFDRCGGSGEEYKKLMEVGVDFNSKEIYVYDTYINSRIYVYTFKGGFKRLLKLSDKNIWLSFMHNYDEDFLFSEDIKYVDHEIDKPKNKTPYIKISKKTGKVIAFPFNINKRVRNRYIPAPRKSTYINVGMPVEPITYNSAEILISDFSLDTIYSLQKDIFMPIAIRENKISDAGLPMLASIDFKTNRYWCWTRAEKIINAQMLDSYFRTKKFPHIDYQQILFDRKENSFYEVDIINSDYLYHDDEEKQPSPNCIASHRATLPANCAMQILSAEVLVELYNENRLRGKLKEIASTLREDDNPILMLVKFKE